MKYLIAPLLILLILPMNSSARQLPRTSLSADTLTYIFWDAPHTDPRHYTIRVTSGQVHYFIQTWEKIIKKGSRRLTKKEYASFVKSLDSLHIKSLPDVIVPGCIGGGSRRIIFYPGTAREVKGYVNFCSGPINGNLEGDIEAVSKLFIALIPNFEKIYYKTIKDE